MIINKNSWHYKFIDTLDVNPGNTLCSYMRALVGVTLLWVVFIVLLLSILFALIYPFVYLAIGGSALLFTIGTIFNGLIAIKISRYYGEDLQDKILFKGRKREPSIIFAWIKSMHDKTCPLIKYED